MRTFVSINVPREIGAYLEKIQRQIAHNNPDVKIKWVEPENFHLCLQFIGETSEIELNTLADRLGQIIKFDPFQIGLTQLGCFPNRFEPRVLYVGAEEPIGKLFILQKKIRDFLLSRRYALDLKPFKPHITLGRLNYQTSFLNLPNELPNSFFSVHHVDLMKSQLTPRGPIYKSVVQYGE
jgi:2'-5' RNA ligase